MRTLAIDLGTRRIGLALSDESGQWASPLTVLSINSQKLALTQIAQEARRQDVKRLVVGLPLNMDDTVGPAARAAVAWGTELAALCGLPVVYVDERLSSFAADQTLIDQQRLGRKLTRKGKKQRQDAIAAADFLQAFLDGRLKAIAIA